MPATFVVTPQWQGSGSSRALRLIDGAETIRGDLPQSSTVTVEVPSGAGSDLGTGIPRLSAIMHVRDALTATLDRVVGVPIVIGGDCGVELAAVEHAARKGDIALLWFAAHGDLDAPDTSPGMPFAGMTLRCLVGDGPAAVGVQLAVAAERVVLLGARSLSDAEGDYLKVSGIVHVPVQAASPEGVAAALQATGATSLYVHVDLDVLDPADFTGVDDPTPFGLGVGELVTLISTARETLPLVGAGIAGFSPSSLDTAADDLPAILRVIGSLTRGL